MAVSHETKNLSILDSPNADRSAVHESDMELSLDALVRSVGVRRSLPHALFLGAGASVTSGVPSAQNCTWEWKRQIFLTNNPGLEDQFSEISLDGVRRRIQKWLDRQGGYPSEGSPEEYSFYIQECFPISDDRRAFFAERVRTAKPHIGYQLICQAAEADLFRSIWSTNFDGLPARAAAGFNLSPIEVGIDSQQRAVRQTLKGELLCVSLHGDYRYDPLKNTTDELKSQEASLRASLIAELVETPLLVCGYSGRDASIMQALHDAYGRPGEGTLYWCGFSDGDAPEEVAELIAHTRRSGRQAFYVRTFGFDDLITRISLHCLEGDSRKAAVRLMEQFAPPDKLTRDPFQVRDFHATTLIKSNSFPIECPSEMLQFDLKTWPSEKVWDYLRERASTHAAVAVPLKGKVLALGTIDAIKDAFRDNIKGAIERVPVTPRDLQYEDSAVVALMREALTRTLSDFTGLPSDFRHQIWKKEARKRSKQGDLEFDAFDSVHLFLRRIGGTQHLVLKPSIRVQGLDGKAAPVEIAAPVKLGILGYQHNREFNQAVNEWRNYFFPRNREPVFEFPPNCGSTFKFRVARSPVFGEIGLVQGGPRLQVPEKVRSLIRYKGIQLTEPDLLFSNRAGTGLISSPHPVRGVAENYPYDFSLTARGFFTSLRIGVICANAEAKTLHRYLQNINSTFVVPSNMKDYLVNYPGFQSAYGIPVELPEPGGAGWFTCPEPTSDGAHTATIELAGYINRGVESLQSSYAPHVVIIFYSERWAHLRGYRTELERFDVHDFVKAFCVQKGIASQFLEESTSWDEYQCRVWWWLSLALYVKGMRTPWVLKHLTENTAFVGLGYSLDPTAPKDRHVVLGCSHIYNNKGEGLQYRLSKIENPIFHGKNPFMSKDDARRTGETIRQLFFDARLKLPDRVVLHKRTYFTPGERDGLADGLSGINAIDMLEVQVDSALRYVASIPKGDGRFDDDNFPVRRGTAMKIDDFTALMWVHGATTALHPRFKYFQGKRRIPTPLIIRRHAGRTDLQPLAEEILGLSKMNWNTFDLYTKLPATLHSSNEIARVGSLLQRFGNASYDYRLFM